MARKLQIKRGLRAKLIPLSPGELALTTDENKLYVGGGDGANHGVSMDGHSHTAAEVGADPAGSAAAVDGKLGGHVGSRSNPHGVTAAQAGAVPTERKVNNRALSADISLTAADVGARPSSWTPTAADVGAAAASHNHSAANITSGTLTVARGGTGQSSLQALLQALHPTSGVTSYISTFGDGWGSGGYATPQVLRSAMGLGGAVVNYIVSITIPNSGWSGDTGGGYYRDITVANMTATAPAKLDFAMTSDKAAGELMVSEFLSNVLRIEQMAGKVRVHTYASGKAPSVNIPVRLSWTA